MKNSIKYLLLLLVALLSSCTGPVEHNEAKKAMVFSAKLNGVEMSTSKHLAGQNADDVVFSIEFSTEVDIEKFNPFSIVFSGGELDICYGENHKVIEQIGRAHV